MFDYLLRLLGDSNLENLENRLYAGAQRLKSLISEYDSLGKFNETENGYELRTAVDADATAKNVTVDYDEDSRDIEVTYRYQRDNYSSVSKFQVSLPDNADDETINATIQDGYLTISVDRYPEKKVAEPEEETDPTVIKVNRK